MKGLTHLTVGVAAATCFPAALRAGVEGNPLPFVLAAVFGILPDTIDFKFVRFFSKRHIEVTPDPNNPDPRLIAKAVSHAMNSAHETGRPVRIKLNTIRLAADRWQQYTVKFDTRKQRVVVQIGPVIGTGGAVITDNEATKKSGAAPVTSRIVIEYQYHACCQEGVYHAYSLYGVLAEKRQWYQL